MSSERECTACEKNMHHHKGVHTPENAQIQIDAQKRGLGSRDQCRQQRRGGRTGGAKVEGRTGAEPLAGKKASKKVHPVDEVTVLSAGAAVGGAAAPRGIESLFVSEM